MYCSTYGDTAIGKKRERQGAKTRQNNRSTYGRTGDLFWGRVPKSL